MELSEETRASDFPSSLPSPSSSRASSDQSCSSSSNHRLWTEEETRKLLSLMRGNEDELGFFARIETKKLERKRAFAEIAELLRK